MSVLLALVALVDARSAGATWSAYLSRSSVRSALRGNKNYMNCTGTTLCGVITLESGFGTGYYEHDKPAVHGLWPEVGGFGSSACVAPADSTPPATVFPCYTSDTGGQDHQLEFEQHEWDTHGICSGVKDATDFFTQICSLAKAPLDVMTKTRTGGATNTSDFAAALTAAGYPVWDEMTQGQVELSACADSDGAWHLAAVSSFVSVCGAGPPAPPAPPGGRCEHNVKGPPCSTDADCVGKPGCIRCAHTGFCTDVPLH